MSRIGFLLGAVPAVFLVLAAQCFAQTFDPNVYAAGGAGSVLSQPLQPPFYDEGAGRVGSPMPLPVDPGMPFPMDPGFADRCCQPPCCPAWQVRGDFLYLRPGRDAVALAVPINGAIVPPAGVAPVQVGNTTLADISFQPAFRVGLGYRFDTCSALELNYTRFEGSTTAHADAVAPIVLRSLVSHPGTSAAPTDFLTADAGYAMQFQLADMAYRGLILGSEQGMLTYVLGGRYAHLDQRLDSTFTNATLHETVDARLNFDGGGIRFGLDGERRFGCSGFSVYASGAASLLGGTFGGRFVEQQVPGAQNPLVLTGWKDDRVVTILDAELGVGWTSENGCLRLKAGYVFSGWLNTPTTDAFIQSVRAGQAGKLNDTLTFDGLTARIELAF